MTGTDGVGAVGAAFEERFGAEPAATAIAPGRVNLVGGHVDYNSGVVLPAAIDRVTTTAVRPREDDRVRAYSLRMDELVEASVGDDPSGWAAYVVGTATVLSGDVGRPLGADVVVGGDMIMGAGLSSSAALEVAIGGALDAAHGLGLSREEIADAGYRAENEKVGMACGIMDQFASALGRAGHALRIDCRDRSVERIPLDVGRTALLVVDTNVSHTLTDSGFNDRVRECHEATVALDTLLGKRVTSLRDVTPEEVERHRYALEAPLADRARHVTTEIRRVEAAADALRDGAVGRVGSLMRESHRSLRDDYEVSCTELNTVVDILDDRSGVHGCRMIGGGWGGSVLALVEPSATADLTAAVQNEYPDRTGIEADTFDFQVGDGLRVVESAR
jgi:galactokinase